MMMLGAGGFVGTRLHAGCGRGQFNDDYDIVMEEDKRCGGPSQAADVGFLSSVGELPASAPRRRGKTRVTRVPRPTSLAMVAEPPCRTAMLLTMASPRPTRPESLERAASAR